MCQNNIIIRAPENNIDLVKIQSTVVISKLKGPVLRHIRFSDLRKTQIAQQNFPKEYVIRLLKLDIYIENIVGKERNCS